MTTRVQIAEQKPAKYKSVLTNRCFNRFLTSHKMVLCVAVRSFGKSRFWGDNGFSVRLSVKVTCLNRLLEINTLCGSFMCEICYVEKYLRGVAGTQLSAEL